MRSQRRWLPNILLFGLLVRAALFIEVQPWRADVERSVTLIGDPVAYHLLATNLLDHRQFSYLPGDPPNSLRTPGYPVFLAGLYGLAGPHTWVPLAAQVLLESLGCWLFYRALLRPFGERVALVSALLFALDPFLIMHTVTLYSETLFGFLMVLLLLAMFGGPESAGTRDVIPGRHAWMGLILGLAILVRPAGELLVPVVLVSLLAASWRRPVTAVARVAIVLLVTLAVLAPWLVRNQRDFGRPFLSTTSAYNLLVLNAAPTLAMDRRIATSEAQAVLLKEADEAMRSEGHDPRTLDEPARAGYWRRVALRELRAHPATFARVYARGMFNTLFNLNTAGLSRMFHRPVRALDLPGGGPAGALPGRGAFARITAILLLPFLVVSYVLVAMGVIAGWKSPRRPQVAFLLAAAAMFVLPGGAGGVARFRMPAVPFYLPLAALGATVVLEGLMARKRRAGTIAAPGAAIRA